MIVPYLVQRCEVSPKKLEYDYMGSAEFEFGSCPKSLKRIFAKGFSRSSIILRIREKEVTVYVIAGEDFVFADYQQYLEQMAEGKLRLKGWSSFDTVIKKQLGIKLDWDRDIRTNAWFDIDNDVLWALTEESYKNLVTRLEHIKQLWAKK